MKYFFHSDLELILAIFPANSPLKQVSKQTKSEPECFLKTKKHFNQTTLTKNISIIIITYNTSEKNSEILCTTNKYKVPFKKFI